MALEVLTFFVFVAPDVVLWMAAMVFVFLRVAVELMVIFLDVESKLGKFQLVQPFCLPHGPWYPFDFLFVLLLHCSRSQLVVPNRIYMDRSLAIEIEWAIFVVFPFEQEGILNKIALHCPLVKPPPYQMVFWHHIKLPIC